MCSKSRFQAELYLKRSVDVLAEAVKSRTIPSELPVLIDYGFFNLSTQEDQANLMGLYVCVIDHFKCDLHLLHQACIQGKLAEFIDQTYSAIPPEMSRGQYYDWFQRRRDAVKNPYPLAAY